MDKREQNNYLTDSNKTEPILRAENDKDNSEETNETKTCYKDEIIHNFIGQIHKKRSLSIQNRNLLQKLEILISRSSNKDYFVKLGTSIDADEWNFRQLLDSVAAIEDKYHETSNKNIAELKTLKEEIRLKKENLMELKNSFKETVEKAALNSVNSETGERFSIEDVKELLTQEEEITKKLEKYQLQSTEKRHILNLALEKKRNLEEGPIDFAKYEMMCIETQNNREIIQSMSEEIKTIMKKTSNIINILSHQGQKLYLAKKEKINSSREVKELEKELNEMRDDTFEEKMKYTKMKHESKELQHKFKLLQYPRLIEDYNAVQKKNEEAQKELQRLKEIYEGEMKILNKKI